MRLKMNQWKFYKIAAGGVIDESSHIRNLVEIITGLLNDAPKIRSLEDFFWEFGNFGSKN